MILLDRLIKDKSGRVLGLRTVMTPGTDAAGPRS